MEMRGVNDLQEQISGEGAHQNDVLSLYPSREREHTHEFEALASAQKISTMGEWRNLKRSYRRLMAKADRSFDQDRLSDAETWFHEALAIAINLLDQVPQDRWLLRDVARLHYGLSQVKRQQGFLDEALSAIRACHIMIEKLADLDPQHASRQNNLTISHAALRDTLEEKGDRRLAIAAGRFAIISAERVADLFEDRPDLRHEVIRQRLALSQLIDEKHGGSEARVHCLEMACASVKELPLPYVITDEAWPDVRRSHLDLANALQLAKRYEETLDALDEFRGYAMLRLVSGPNEIAQNNAVALADYLAGLVHVMKKDFATAVSAFVKGLSLYEAVPSHIFMTDEVQQQRAKLLGEAVKAADQSSDPSLKPMLEKMALRRLTVLLNDTAITGHHALDVMARSHELARMLIVKQVPHLALHCLAFAESILIKRSQRDENPVFVQRWAGFLKLEEGRALGAMARPIEAQEALRTSLALNGELWASNPEDIRAQCDIAYAEWQLAPLAPSAKREHLTRSRAILRLLDRTGRLPDYAKPWLDEIERDLRAA
jgi:tetratricopeptide (TPR) repeat protein